MDDESSPASRLLEGIAVNTIYALMAGLIGLSLVGLGLVSNASIDQPFEWPMLVALAGFLAFTLAIARLVRLLKRFRAQNRLGTASGTRIAILLPRIAGDDRHGSRREIVRQALLGRFQDSIELLLWPESLTLPEGRDSKATGEMTEKAWGWLEASRCDAFVAGSTRGDAALSFRIGSRAAGIIERVYPLTGEGLALPNDFASDIADTIMSHVLAEASIAADQGRARLGDLNRIAIKFEALLRNLSAPQVILGYTGVLMRLAEHSGSRDVAERAVEMAIEVLDRFEEELDPQRQFVANSNVASMLIGLGHISGEPGAFHRAKAYIDKARHLSPNQGPDINYGILLAKIGSAELNRDLLEQALGEFGAIVAEEDRYDSETVGKAFHNMGMVYCELFKITSDHELLHGAVAMLELALLHRPREDVPFYWAKTNCSLGGALTMRGHALRDAADHEACLRHLAQAKEIYKLEGRDAEREQVEYNMAIARADLATLTGSTETLVQAVIELEEIERTWSGSPDRRLANVQNALGTIYMRLAIVQSDPDLAERASEYFAASRPLLTDDDAEATAGTAFNSAHAIMVAGVLRREIPLVARAAADLEIVYDGLRAQGEGQLTRMVADTLVECYEKLAILSDDAAPLSLARAVREDELHRARADDPERLSELSLHVASLDLLCFAQTQDTKALDRATSTLETLLLQRGPGEGHSQSPALAVAESLLAQARELRQDTCLMRPSQPNSQT